MDKLQIFHANQTSICLVHISNIGEVGTVKLVYACSNFLTDRRKEVNLLWIFFILCLYLLYCLVCVMQPCGHLLGKGWLLGSPVCDVFLCFCHFPIWCSRSCVVLDCIDY